MARISAPTTRSRLLACIALGALVTAVPAEWGGVGPAAAQQRLSVSAQFRTALDPYGAWHHNRRFGDVWVPASRPHNWRPYTAGRWVYTETYGWYWVEDVEEVDWGWITYHYGRWYLDSEDGWIWITGDEWSPGWVDWRYGNQTIGWAPLAPAEVVVEVEERPEYWAFVRERDFVAPRLDQALLPPQEARVYFQRTAVVNRTVELRDRHFAVNPGIPAAYVAAAYGRPLQAFDVRPRVLAGTANVPGAMQIRAEDLRRREPGNQPGRPGARIVMQPSGTLISPTAARSLPPPQPLARGEPGRLGAAPPLAARGPAPPTTDGRAPAEPAAQPPGGRREGLVPPGGGGQPPGDRRATPNPRAGATTPPAAATREPPPRPSAVERQTGGREAMPQRGSPGSERRSFDQGPAGRAPATAAPRPAPPPSAAAPQREVVPPRQAAPQREIAPSAPPPAAARPAAPPPAAAARPQGPSTTGAAPAGHGPQRRE